MFLWDSNCQEDDVSMSLNQASTVLVSYQFDLLEKDIVFTSNRDSG